VRRIAVLLAVLFTASLSLVTTPARACACGALINPDNVGVTDETALIRHDGATEDIVMRLALTGEPRDAAWILPVPAEPAFALAEDALFADLVQLTRPRVVVEKEWFPRAQPLTGAAPGDGAAAGGVDVIGQSRVGPYEVATLAASDADALSGWLTAHGYALSPDLARGVAPYVTLGWRYVAVKLHAPAGAQRLGRTLPPLRVTFRSTEIVYPMRLTAVAHQGQPVHLFVLADHRVRATGVAGGDRLRFAGWLDPATLGSPVAAYLPRRMFLTRFDGYVAPAAATDDFHFRFEASDEEYREVVHRTEVQRILGYPAGPVLVVAGFAMIATLAGAVVALVVLRRRIRRAARERAS
jgi:hypothetical protein